MSDARQKRLMLTLLLAGLVAIFWILGLACEQLEDGKCKRDSHCEGMAKTAAEVWICYKEPAEASLGECMRVQDARAAQNKYKAKVKASAGEAKATP